MGLCLGIDLGGTAIKLGLVDEHGKIHDTTQVPTLAETGDPKKIMQNMIDASKTFISKSKDKAIAAGIGIPGGVDPSTGTVTLFPNIRCMDGYPVARELEDGLSIPTYIDNDANNAARGELLFGAGIGYKNFVMVTLGTGVGGGIIINGDIYDGAVNYSGEVGHMTLVPDGKQCGCGKYGCWEAYGSAAPMIKMASSYIDNGIDTKLKKYYPDKLEIKVIVDEAQAGDPVAAAIFDDAMRFNGIGIANLINIFNPEAILIGGGISNAGDFLLKKVSLAARLYTLPVAWNACKIVLAKNANKAGLLGSAALAFMKLKATGKNY